MRAPEDLTGRRFGHLVVIERNGVSPAGGPRWFCRCDCGSTKLVVTGNLKCGRTLSCGCLRRAMNPLRARTHGHSKTRTYCIWVGMFQRCENPKSSAFARYGGRGIRVCERWSDFAAFLSDMGEAPEGRSIDRIDNDGPYSPENCRWADRATQVNNRRKTRRVNGVPLSEVAASTGANYFTLWSRHFRVRTR